MLLRVLSVSVVRYPMTLPKPSTPRRRGAPCGNKNALKHGFYSRQLARSDLDGLKDLRPISLDNEIVLVRVLIRRLVASSQGITDFERLSGLVRTLYFATVSLTRLLRTRHLVEGKHDERAEEFDRAIEELFGDRPLFKDYFPK